MADKVESFIDPEACDRPEYEAEHEGWSTATVCINCGWLLWEHDPAKVLARESLDPSSIDDRSEKP